MLSIGRDNSSGRIRTGVIVFSGVELCAATDSADYAKRRINQLANPRDIWPVFANMIAGIMNFKSSTLLSRISLISLKPLYNSSPDFVR